MSRSGILFAAAALSCAVAMLGGCGDAAPTKAPAMTGPPHKKWAQLSKDEKIKVIESQPIPNKAKMIQRVKDGLE